MSEDNLNLDENQIHYIYGDQEYVLGGDGIVPELSDLSCVETSKAILVDGQFIVADNQTILLQDADSNLTQYYINCNSEGFIVDSEETTTNTLFEATECMQLIEEDTNEASQIIYYANDDSNTEEFTPIGEGDADAQIQDEDGIIFSKRIKLEGRLLNYEEFVQQQASLETQNENESLEYAILEDGTALKQDQSSQSGILSNLDGSELIDLSKITGRNLITGQTVTLYSYMEKLKKRLTKSNAPQRKSPKKSNNGLMTESRSKDGETKKPELSDLLDKKISIGTTKSGKRIIGKIIHVERGNTNKMNNTAEEEEEEGQIDEEDRQDVGETVVNDAQDFNQNLTNVICEDAEKEDEEETRINEDPLKILVKKCSVSIDSFDDISKTLGGVMEMESVRKKLENKNIVVKLVEKRYVTESESYVKGTSYSYGYMERSCSEDGNGETLEKWRFVPDQETQDVLLGEHLLAEEENGEKKSTKFPTTTTVTIVVTYERAGTKSIRVNLNPAPGNLCTICVQFFKTNLQLRTHMRQVHDICNGSNNAATTCEICDRSFESPERLEQHRLVHVEGMVGGRFVCQTCGKCFPSRAKLRKHLPSHDVFFALECTVCEVRCSSEWALKRHLLTHTGIKPFACDICQKQFTTQYDMNFHKKIHFPEKYFACNVCMRTFSRHSNLLRHTEIHKGDGALYKCEVCCCSFNYISSLTRHMVQNHIEPGDSKK